MAYYTSFELDVDADNYMEIIAEFRANNREAEISLADDGGTSQDVSWYCADDHLKEFSKQYPDVLFTLRGEGEESGDMWILYVKNGKSQKERAKITFNKFDESKLK